MAGSGRRPRAPAAAAAGAPRVDPPGPAAYDRPRRAPPGAAAPPVRFAAPPVAAAAPVAAFPQGAAMTGANTPAGGPAGANGAAAPAGPTDAAAPGRSLHLRVGTAGWSYRDWEGIVYGPARTAGPKPLERLLGLFPTLEVNVTFYRDVAPRQLAAWCRAAADRPDFRWCFKLPRRLSHAGPPPARGDLLAACAAFAPAREAGQLGALLLQFPWSLRPGEATVAALADLAAAAREAGWPLVLEVRHAAWGEAPPFPPVVCDQPPLRGNLGPDEALAAALAAWPRGAGPLYLRLHGRNRAAWFAPDAGRDARYDYLYGDAELREWVARLRRAEARLPAAAPVFLITNNHYQGQAVVNALQLQRLWSGEAPPVPASLRQAYPRELASFPVAAEPAPPGAPASPGSPGATNQSEAPLRPGRRPRGPRRGPGDGGAPTLF